MDNFKCGSCGHTFFVPRYSVRLQNKTAFYSDKFGSIRCPECKALDISVITDGDVCSNIGDYSSASWEQKKKILQVRAKRAMRKDREQRVELDRHFRGHVNEKHY
jgi:hypothetical protein